MLVPHVKGRILICAGSDSSGGAGIQADIKAITALRGYAMTAVTALTAQNTHGIAEIHLVPPSFIAKQMSLCLDDIGADVIKTGMLSTTAIIEAVGTVIKTARSDVPLVVDPVMVGKHGTMLLEGNAVEALIKHLITRATLITPNLPEARTLLGDSQIVIDSLASMITVARRLLKFSPAVLLKGGHLSIIEENIMDILVTRSGAVRCFIHPRINSSSTHGTGCTLAAAIACGLAQDLPLEEAVRRARTYVYQAIATAPGFGYGYGPLNHIRAVF